MCTFNHGACIGKRTRGPADYWVTTLRLEDWGARLKDVENNQDKHLNLLLFLVFFFFCANDIVINSIWLRPLVLTDCVHDEETGIHGRV